MKRFASCLLPLAFFIISCRPAAAPVSVSNRPASINDVPQAQPLKEMAWKSVEGSLVKVGDLEGKVLILDFWATYCEPCKQEIPHLNELQAKYAGDGLLVVGLHAGGDEDVPKIDGFRKQTAIDYAIAYPSNDFIRFVFGNDSRIPQTLVIDRRGRIVNKIIGFNDQIKKELDASVSDALSSS